MAYDITNDSFLEKTKVDLAAEFGEGAFVELREPSKKEFLSLIKSREGGEDAIEAAFAALLPKLIVSHGFISAGKPATSDQVAGAIGMKIKASNKVESEYLGWVSAPFQKQSEQK